MHAWTGAPPVKVQLLTADGHDPDPDAMCCCGMSRHDTGRVMLRFVEDRPLGGVTIQFLAWVGEGIAGEGNKVLMVVWDEASWHRSGAVSGWVRSTMSAPGPERT
jgi:hypothetical protein